MLPPSHHNRSQKLRPRLGSNNGYFANGYDSDAQQYSKVSMTAKKHAAQLMAALDSD